MTTFKELESPAYNFFYYYTQPISTNEKKKLKRNWLLTLKNAGWTKKKFNSEFFKHYPNPIKPCKI